MLSRQARPEIGAVSFIGPRTACVPGTGHQYGGNNRQWRYGRADQSDNRRIIGCCVEEQAYAPGPWGNGAAMPRSLRVVRRWFCFPPSS